MKFIGQFTGTVLVFSSDGEGKADLPDDASIAKASMVIVDGKVVKAPGLVVNHSAWRWPNREPSQLTNMRQEWDEHHS